MTRGRKEGDRFYTTGNSRHPHHFLCFHVQDTENYGRFHSGFHCTLQCSLTQLTESEKINSWSNAQTLRGTTSIGTSLNLVCPKGAVFTQLSLQTISVLVGDVSFLTKDDFPWSWLCFKTLSLSVCNFQIVYIRNKKGRKEADRVQGSRRGNIKIVL